MGRQLTYFESIGGTAIKYIALMVTYNYEDLLPTITSRLQLINILFSEEELKGYLVKNHGATVKDAIKAYRISNEALHAVADIEEGNQDQLNWFADWMRYCISAKYDFLSQISEQFKQIRVKTTD